MSKIFRVVTERDGETTKEPGKTSTEIKRTEYRFAAESMERVWNELPKRIPADEEVIAIIEEHPAITILDK